jgi:putative endonuclease
MVEHSAVNRRVVGSSPTRGAKPKTKSWVFQFKLDVRLFFILQSVTSGKYYVGVSDNPERRLTYHNSTERGFTSMYRPLTIKYVKEYPTKKETLSIERKIKSMKSKKNEEIISRKLKI